MPHVFMRRRGGVPATGPTPGGGGFAAPDIAVENFESGWPHSPFDGISGNETVITDGTAPSATHVLQSVYTSGAEESGGAEGNFPSSTTTKCFLRWYYKQDATFDNTGIKKFCRFQGAGFNGIYGTLINLHGQLNWTWDGGSGDWFITSPTVDSFRNAWHCYEVMNDISTGGLYHVKIWLDGVLKLDQVDTFGQNYGAVTIGAVEVMGIFNTPACNGTDWIDSIAVSTQRIGP